MGWGRAQEGGREGSKAKREAHDLRFEGFFFVFLLQGSTQTPFCWISGFVLFPTILWCWVLVLKRRRPAFSSPLLLLPLLLLLLPPPSSGYRSVPRGVASSIVCCDSSHGTVNAFICSRLSVIDAAWCHEWCVSLISASRTTINHVGNRRCSPTSIIGHRSSMRRCCWTYMHVQTLKAQAGLRSRQLTMTMTVLMMMMMVLMMMVMMMLMMCCLRWCISKYREHFLI